MDLRRTIGIWFFIGDEISPISTADGRAPASETQTGREGSGKWVPVCSAKIVSVSICPLVVLVVRHLSFLPLLYRNSVLHSPPWTDSGSYVADGKLPKQNKKMRF